MKKDSDNKTETFVITCRSVQHKKTIEAYADSRGISASAFIQKVMIDALEAQKRNR